MGAGKEQSQILVLPTSTVLFLTGGMLVVHRLYPGSHGTSAASAANESPSHGGMNKFLLFLPRYEWLNTPVSMDPDGSSDSRRLQLGLSAWSDVFKGKGRAAWNWMAPGNVLTASYI